MPSEADADFRRQLFDECGKHMVNLLKPGAVHVAERNLAGKLENGIRTTMGIGDMNVLGELVDAPAADNVESQKNHYFSAERIKNTPSSMLLDTFTLTGKTDTENGKWKIVHEDQRTKIWAFLLALIEQKQESDQTLYKKMMEAAEKVEVMLLCMQEKDVLWQEWSKSEDNALNDIHFSTDRGTVRYNFMSKLCAALQLENPGTKVQRKDIFVAFEEAEKKGLFSTSSHVTKIRLQDVASALAFGEQMIAWKLMDMWRELEVLPIDGKTPLYSARFAVTFPAMVHDSKEEATYVLCQLKRIYSQDVQGKAQLNKKKLLEGCKSQKQMKATIKALAFQYLWAKSLVTSCENQSIQAPQKAKMDFDIVNQAFDIELAMKLVEDKTGKKASLHECSAQLLNVCLSVLVKLEHYNAFSAADALNKPFAQACRTDSLGRLMDEGVMNDWKLVSARYLSEMEKEKKAEQGGAEQAEEKDEEIKELTRDEAIQKQAVLEVETYCLHLIRTGDPALDRDAILRFPIVKKDITKDTANWNSHTQGCRRATLFDQTGAKNPRHAYVKGRNPYRTKLGFAVEDFKEQADTWSAYAAPGEGDKKDKIDVLTVWTDQSKASRAIRDKAATFPGVSTKKTTLKAMQIHVERRLWSSPEPPTGADNHLDGLPGVSEECIDIFAGALPERKKHLHTFGPFNDNLHPEEIIPLRNPAKSEPQVSMTVKKQIFPPDFDEPAGSNCLREDEVGTC
jgi:hypothetical protein